MGSFTFKWPHAAQEVYVTGTFDNWSKTEKLEKVGDVFEKTVTLPDASEKIFYKFVVDGNWTTDFDAPQEKDHDGNDNNVLKPEDIVKEPTPAAAIMSHVTPESTTAQLAGEVPLEEKDVSIPGGYPETPAADLEKEVRVNPLPAADGAINPINLAPGEKIPESITTQDINSHVTLDKESYENSDAFPGIGAIPPISSNMIPESSLPIAGSNDVTINSAAPESTTASLAAGVPLEPKVPEVVKESQEEANVEPEASGISEEVAEKAQVEDELLSKVSEVPSTSEGTAGQGTEKSESDKTLTETIAAAASVAGAVAVETAINAKEKVVGAASEAASNLPEPVKEYIPEPVKEYLPEPVKQNGTAAKEEATIETISPEVPTEVKESIKDSGESPEAAANTGAVEDKKAVEDELLKEVKAVEPIPEAPAVPVEEAKIQTISPEVPIEVKESIKDSGESPEAAANTGAVEDKKAVEDELLKEVKAVEPIPEAPAVPVEEAKTETISPEVPIEVKESIKESGESPEAAANTEAVEDKKAVEGELLQEVKTVEPISEVPAETAGEVKIKEPAAEPTAVVLKAEEAPVEEPKVEEPAIETKPATNGNGAHATNGNGAHAGAAPGPVVVAEPAAPAIPAVPASAEHSTPSASKHSDIPASPASPATTEKKKKHRLSAIFGKFKKSKDKLSKE